MRTLLYVDLCPGLIEESKCSRRSTVGASGEEYELGGVAGTLNVVRKRKLHSRRRCRLIDRWNGGDKEIPAFVGSPAEPGDGNA